MLKVHAEALDFVERSQHYTALQPLIDDFSEMVSGQGFGTFIMTGLPAVGTDFDQLMICNHWPEAWAKRYGDENYFPDDPVSKWSLVKDRPFHWAKVRGASPENERVKQINGEAKGFGLVDGIAFPMRTSKGWQAVMSLASDRPVDVSKRDEGMLLMASIYFQMAATDMMSSERATVAITPREKEIRNGLLVGKRRGDLTDPEHFREDGAQSHECHPSEVQCEFDDPGGRRGPS